MEGALDFFYGIAQDYRAAVRAAHRAIGFGEGAEQPFHFCLVERHVDFDGGVTRGGRRDFRLQRFDGNRGVFALDAVENFGQKLFGVAVGYARGNGLDRDAARTHGFDLEAVGAKALRQFFRR